MIEIRVKSVFAEPVAADGFRVMVDTRFPKGKNPENAGIDLWLGQIAPTARSQKRFRDDRDRWGEFLDRYHEELDENSEAITLLFNKADKERITLVFSGRDLRYNTAVALKRYLDGD